VETTLRLALVDGERVGAIGGATLDVVNAATNTVIGRIPRCDERDVEVAVAAAKRAAPGWRSTEPQMRAAGPCRKLRAGCTTPCASRSAWSPGSSPSTTR
jgi:hypothetical protein